MFVHGRYNIITTCFREYTRRQYYCSALCKPELKHSKTLCVEKLNYYMIWSLCSGDSDLTHNRFIFNLFFFFLFPSLLLSSCALLYSRYTNRIIYRQVVLYTGIYHGGGQVVSPIRFPSTTDGRRDRASSIRKTNYYNVQ